ncbi:glycoside hydrolase superfamily [Chlamydoabsidia padenii]|nr:glycoside hydrolase superfamily [Chlamydoabsidia padenii]
MIELNGPWFVDKDTNRTVFFHGINVGGGAKLPVGFPSHARHGYWLDYDRKVTFVGRPFPLEEADLHLQRLVSLGFNLLRFIVTWEAIEHEGPGIYDFEYLDYVIQVLKKCRQYGLQVFIDPHQDTWSRHCGGSGHPGWTLALAGLNPLHFTTTIAALVHNDYDPPESFPRMIWNTNLQRLAAATMLTLFFAGKTFAPYCMVDQVNIQDYLQTHFFGAITQLARRIKQYNLEDNVVLGYDTMNEPGGGYLECPDLNKLNSGDTSFKMGLMPTGFQGMLLASGIPCKVANYEFIWSGPKKTGDVLVNPGNNNNNDVNSAWMTQTQLDESCRLFGWKRGSCWQKAGCIWENHGVWDRNTRSLLLPHYFATHPDTKKPTQFAEDYWLPFLTLYMQAIRSIHTTAIIFIQPPILEKPPKLPDNDPLFQRMVYTPHWYDGLTLVKRKWCNYNVDFINLSRGKYGTGPLRFIRALSVGEKAIRKCFVKQMKTIQAEGLEQIGNYPCLLGEFGIPYDMEGHDSSTTVKPTKTTPVESPLGPFQHAWQQIWLWVASLFFVATLSPSSKKSSSPVTPPVAINNINKPNSSQNKAMDASINALEGALLNYTLWQYVPDNDPTWGDLWNGENLSIWQQARQQGSISSSASTTTIKIADDEKVNGTDSSLSTLNSKWTTEDERLDANDINQRQLVCLYRPRPHLTAGTPTAISFTSPTRETCAYYRYEFQPNGQCTNNITELHVPKYSFPPPPETTTQIQVSKGHYKVHTIEPDYWLLHWWWDDNEDIPEKMVLELKGTQWIV